MFFNFGKFKQNNRDCAELFALDGVVVSVEKRSKISTSKEKTYMFNNGVFLVPVGGGTKVSSSEITEVWISKLDEEKQLVFQDVDIPVRKGHVVSAIFANEIGAKEGYQIMFLNHTTGTQMPLCNLDELIDRGWLSEAVNGKALKTRKMLFFIMTFFIFGFINYIYPIFTSSFSHLFSSIFFGVLSATILTYLRSVYFYARRDIKLKATAKKLKVDFPTYLKNEIKVYSGFMKALCTGD